ncbi:neuropeptide-like protein 30 [Pecten maximus]|uniref:neuropeptide-like protein 30 n=1 Tax=Pecten maximus TaxID=6579 RepID=UPI001458AD18|nr:neuropeptide-like protein 30 [Pecten maximus]
MNQLLFLVLCSSCLVFIGVQSYGGYQGYGQSYPPYDSYGGGYGSGYGYGLGYRNSDSRILAYGLAFLVAIFALNLSTLITG